MHNKLASDTYHVRDTDNPQITELRFWLQNAIIALQKYINRGKILSNPYAI